MRRHDWIPRSSTVAVGSKDDTVDVHEAHRVAACMARGRSIVIADAPHPIERVPVEAIVAAVADLMRQSGELLPGE